jgi:DNA-binding XRE family transcriptional regulator
MDCHPGCHPLGFKAVDRTAEAGDLTVDRARLQSLRRDLGARLATYRMAAGVSQPELGHAVGRTRSTISKIEHGIRGMPARLWKITDDVCRADGALVPNTARWPTLSRTIGPAVGPEAARCGRRHTPRLRPG